MWIPKLFNIIKFTKLKFTANLAFVYLATPEDSSGTTTLRLQATRSRSVAISLLGALLCICRTPSICPLRLNPIFGGECTSEVELIDPKKSKSDSCTWSETLRETFKNSKWKEKKTFYLIYYCKRNQILTEYNYFSNFTVTTTHTHLKQLRGYSILFKNSHWKGRINKLKWSNVSLVCFSFEKLLKTFMWSQLLLLHSTCILYHGDPLYRTESVYSFNSLLP